MNLLEKEAKELEELVLSKSKDDLFDIKQILYSKMVDSLLNKDEYTAIRIASLISRIDDKLSKG